MVLAVQEILFSNLIFFSINIYFYLLDFFHKLISDKNYFRVAVWQYFDENKKKKKIEYNENNFN